MRTVHLLGVLVAGLLLPLEALAHLGGTDPQSFLGSFVHPFTGPDHLITSLIVASVTLVRHRNVPWLPTALFCTAIALGYLLVLFGIRIPHAEPLFWMMGLGVAIHLFMGERTAQTTGMVLIAAMGAFLGHHHASLLPNLDPAACLCGMSLAAGTFVLTLAWFAMLLFANRLRPTRPQAGAGTH
ncbi:MAG: HupE/UreJ family protein [Gammaproteobacteria bacterium]